MASATLRGVFLHPANDLGTYLALENCVGITEDITGPAEVKLLANGLTTRSSMRGTVTSVALQFEACTRAEVDQLRDWSEEMLMLRDPRGRLHFGAYDSKQIQVTESIVIDRADVSLTFTVVSSFTAIPVVGAV